MAYIDDFKARFPEFDETTVDTYIPLISPSFPCFYGAIYGVGGCNDQVLLLLGAHLLTLEMRAGSGALKDVASRGVDGVSVSYTNWANYNSNDAFFNTTKYGQRYLQITKRNNGAIFV